MGFAVALGAMAWLCVHAADFVGVSVPTHDAIPVLATVSSALSLGIIGILLHSTARCLRSPWRRCFVSITICLYIFWGHFPVRAAGHETYLFIALMMLGGHLMIRSASPITAAVALVGATLARPDAALFVVLLGLVLTGRFLIQQRRGDVPGREAQSLIILLGVYAIGLSLWGGFLYVYFGTPLPGTMLAKQAQLVLGHFQTFTVMLALERLWAHTPGVIPVILVAGIVCGFVEWGGRCYQKGGIATTEPPPAWDCDSVVLPLCSNIADCLRSIRSELLGVVHRPRLLCTALSHDPEPEGCICCCRSSAPPQDGTGAATRRADRFFRLSRIGLDYVSF